MRRTDLFENVARDAADDTYVPVPVLGVSDRLHDVVGAFDQALDFGVGPHVLQGDRGVLQNRRRFHVVNSYIRRIARPGCPPLGRLRAPEVFHAHVLDPVGLLLLPQRTHAVDIPRNELKRFAGLVHPERRLDRRILPRTERHSGFFLE